MQAHYLTSAHVFLYANEPGTVPITAESTDSESFHIVIGNTTLTVHALDKGEFEPLNERCKIIDQTIITLIDQLQQLVQKRKEQEE